MSGVGDILRTAVADLGAVKTYIAANIAPSDPASSAQAPTADPPPDIPDSFLSDQTPGPSASPPLAGLAPPGQFASAGVASGRSGAADPMVSVIQDLLKSMPGLAGSPSASQSVAGGSPQGMAMAEGGDGNAARTAASAGTGAAAAPGSAMALGGSASAAQVLARATAATAAIQSGQAGPVAAMPRQEVPAIADALAGGAVIDRHAEAALAPPIGLAGAAGPAGAGAGDARLAGLDATRTATAAQERQAADGAHDARRTGREADLADAARSAASASAAQATRSDAGDLAARDALTARDLAALAARLVTDSAATPGAGTIISSFIMNAAMIPGWPQHRFRDDIGEKLVEIQSRVQQDLELSEEELIAYLANFGLNEQLIGKLRAAQTKPDGMQKALGFLASLMSALSSVLDTLKQEIADLAEELANMDRLLEQGGDPAPGARHKLFIK